MILSRSREGAWIEIVEDAAKVEEALSRSREGAWIEIQQPARYAHTVPRRSREGAWIEIAPGTATPLRMSVAPARERGLKFKTWYNLIKAILSLPRGSVD